jgi:FKBP-type peptidyl-prolyl cis-trans isomerase 2
MATKKNDFIELDFIGRIDTKDGPIFDTTNFEKAKEAELADEKTKSKFKPVKLCIGQEMVLKSLDKDLEGKEVGKTFHLEIKVKEAYGNRDTKLIRTVPLTSFEEMPQRGMFVNVNGMVAKVVSVNGGRVIIDMNHPLAGKDLFYEYKILKIIEDAKEKANVILEMFGINEKNVDLKENKLIIKQKVQDVIQQVAKKKIKELLNIEIEFSESKKSLEEELGDKVKKEEK